MIAEGIKDPAFLMLITKRDELKKRADEVNGELSKVNRAISALSATDLEPNQWTKQSITCIHNHQCLLTTNALLECIYFQRQDELNGNRRMLMTGLSVALSNLFTSKILGRIKIEGKKGFAYGLADWFEPNLITLKKQHRNKEIKQTIY